MLGRCSLAKWSTDCLECKEVNRNHVLVQALWLVVLLKGDVCCDQGRYQPAKNLRLAITNYSQEIEEMTQRNSANDIDMTSLYQFNIGDKGVHMERHTCRQST